MAVRPYKRAGILFIAVLLLFAMLVAETGCGRSGGSGRISLGQSGTSSESGKTSNDNTPVEEALGMAEDVVESKYVGEWEGIYYYTIDIDKMTSGDYSDFENGMELSGGRYSQFNLNINSTGSASYDYNINGESGFESNLKLEPGRSGKGYVVYNRQGNMIGDVEYGTFSDGSKRVTYYEIAGNNMAVAVECVRK